MEEYGKIKNLYYESYEWLGQQYRKKYHRKKTKSQTSYTLTKEERKKVNDVFDPFVKVNPVFHAFYTEKTGVFSPLYIPDDVHFSKIDTYFNDWRAARIVDNKCFYERMFNVGGGKASRYVCM
jgi:hypothetical protein